MNLWDEQNISKNNLPHPMFLPVPFCRVLIIAVHHFLGVLFWIFQQKTPVSVGKGEVSLNLVTLTKLNETHPPFEGRQNIQWTCRGKFNLFRVPTGESPPYNPVAFCFESLISAGQLYKYAVLEFTLNWPSPLAFSPWKDLRLPQKPSQAYRRCRWTLNFPKVEPVSPNIPGMPKILYSNQ